MQMYNLMKAKFFFSLQVTTVKVHILTHLVQKHHPGFTVTFYEKPDFLFRIVYVGNVWYISLWVWLADFNKKQQKSQMISTLFTSSEIVTAKLQRKERKVNRASHTVSPISKLRTPHHIHITHPLYYTGLPTHTQLCNAVQCSLLGFKRDGQDRTRNEMCCCDRRLEKETHMT